MHETKNRRRSGCLIGCGVIGAALLALGGLGGWLLWSSYQDGFIDREDYDAVAVGTAEAEVRRALPDGDSFLVEGLGRGGPAVPAQSSCLRLLSTDSLDGTDDVIVFRFCFRDGALVEKTSYPSTD